MLFCLRSSKPQFPSFAVLRRLAHSQSTANLFDSQRQCFIERLPAVHSNGTAGVSVLNLNRTEAKNALGKQMLTEMSECIRHIQLEDSQTRVLIVRSLVDRVFCAGADLKERATMNEQQVAQFVYRLRSIFTELEKIPIPTIAAIDGAALGGGLELALCCDMRVAGPKSVLGLPETKLAIIPGAGGTQRLPRLIGVSRAKELIFTGKRLYFRQALDFGLVNAAVSEQDGRTAFDKALELAREIEPQGPVALRMAKIAIQQGSQLDIQSGLAVEQLAYAQVIPTKDRQEGLLAFKEKRPAIYRGH